MTPLFKRIIAEHRNLVVPLAVALVVNLLAYVLVVRPRGVKAEGAADRAVAATAALQAAERDQSVASALVSGKARADEELNAFYEKVLPRSHDEAVRMTYASLPALAQKSGVNWARRNYELENEGQGQKNENLGHLAISMTLQGDYEDFRRFIYALESAPEFLIIDDIALTQVNMDDPLTLVISMSTYFRLNRNAR